MQTYRIVWEMELEADSAEEAAAKCLRIHRDPESIATVFRVTDESGLTLSVDLTEETTAPV